MILQDKETYQYLPHLHNSLIPSVFSKKFSEKIPHRSKKE